MWEQGIIWCALVCITWQSLYTWPSGLGAPTPNIICNIAHKGLRDEGWLRISMLIPQNLCPMNGSGSGGRLLAGYPLWGCSLQVAVGEPHGDLRGSARSVKECFRVEFPRGFSGCNRSWSFSWTTGCFQIQEYWQCVHAYCIAFYYVCYGVHTGLCVICMIVICAAWLEKVSSVRGVPLDSETMQVVRMFITMQAECAFHAGTLWTRSSQHAVHSSGSCQLPTGRQRWVLEIYSECGSFPSQWASLHEFA